MAFPLIYKGGDEVLNITLTDSTGAAINPNDCEDITVDIYQKKEFVVQQFKLSNATIIIQNEDTGQIRVMLDAESTSKLDAGRVYMQVILEINNVQFDKIQKFVKADIPICDLKESVS